jgi:predicted acetyltransferase
VNERPDVSCGIDVIGQLYLGGGDALALAAAGRLDGEPAAVNLIHRLFRTDRPPWCPEVF